MRSLTITPSHTSRNEETLDRYLSEVSQLARIDAAEEARLARKIQDGDKAALDRLVSANLRFVVSCAKKYEGNGMRLDDLISEGNLGLIRAARSFNETRGFKFISYAVWWIRQSILHAIGVHQRIVRLPMNQQLGISALKKEHLRLEQLLEREPSLDELAEVLEKSPAQLADFVLCNARETYLDDQIPGETERNSLMEYLCDEDGSELVDNWMESQAMQSEVSTLLSRLDERERRILVLYYGLGGVTALDDGDLSRVINLSKERIRQIRANAIKKLQVHGRC